MVAERRHARERGMQFHKEKPQAAAMRARLWRSMRILRIFSRNELTAVSGITTRGVTWRFLHALEREGYLTSEPRGRAHRLVYRLAKDTGPVAPRPFSDGTIFDPNLIPR